MAPCKLSQYSKSFVYVFKTKEYANQYLAVNEIIYINATHTTHAIKTVNLPNVKEHYNIETEEVYVVSTTYPFNIKFSTLKSKLCAAIDSNRYHCLYIMTLLNQLMQNDTDLDNEEMTEKLIIKNLELYMLVENYGVNVGDEILKEKEKELYGKNFKSDDSGPSSIKKKNSFKK